MIGSLPLANQCKTDLGLSRHIPFSAFLRHPWVNSINRSDEG
jgi:hypothetical protein